LPISPSGKFVTRYTKKTFRTDNVYSDAVHGQNLTPRFEFRRRGTREKSIKPIAELGIYDELPVNKKLLKIDPSLMDDPYNENFEVHVSQRDVQLTTGEIHKIEFTELKPATSLGH
jgi:hypothetical protein